MLESEIRSDVRMWFEIEIVLCYVCVYVCICDIFGFDGLRFGFELEFNSWFVF